MISSLLRRGVVLAALMAGVPHLNMQQASGQVPGACCRTCRLPGPTCTCTTMHPVVQTQYKQEQVVSYHNVNRVGLRQEAYCETVPKTQVYNVTRDEGHYQMVWVPKPVTRQYAKTVYEQRMAQRTVPYHYTECVPRVCTQIVPEETVSYVPVTTTTQTTVDVTTCTAPPVCVAPPPPMCAAPVMPGCAAPNCAIPGVIDAAIPAPYTATPVAPMQPIPQSLAPLTGSYYNQPSPGVVPDAQYLDTPAAAVPQQQWTTVPARPTSVQTTQVPPQYGAVQPAGYRAPYQNSAAAVWQSQRR